MNTAEKIRILCNAQCNAEVWWSLARLEPIAAMRSPLFDLLTLEDPGRWQALEAGQRPDWIAHLLTRLDPDTVLCQLPPWVERVIPVFMETSIRPTGRLQDHFNRAHDAIYYPEPYTKERLMSHDLQELYSDECAPRPDIDQNIRKAAVGAARAVMHFGLAARWAVDGSPGSAGHDVIDSIQRALSDLRTCFGARYGEKAATREAKAQFDWLLRLHNEMEKA